jgi:endonuclease/exonuclease/phosphatase family metal-dependent hydrolase
MGRQLKILTINLLSDLSRWPVRRDLLARQVWELDADLIALQEVKLPENTAAWLANRLNERPRQASPYRLYLTPRTGKPGRQEAVAILTRLPVEESGWLDLKSQNRVAQAVRVRTGENREAGRIVFTNGHFYWHTGESVERDKQVQLLLSWLQEHWGGPPVVICGDFNAGPGTRTIKILLEQFKSAYAERHGREPEYTYPTPLPTSRLHTLHTAVSFLGNIRLTDLGLSRKRTFDYIFLSPSLRVVESKVVLNKPAAHNPHLYPSDHFGLFAIVEV